MTDNHRDQVVDEVVDKVEHRQSIDHDPEVVRAHAEQAVDELIDQPLQTSRRSWRRTRASELIAEGKAAEERS